jgi:hypothetical protein
MILIVFNSGTIKLNEDLIDVLEGETILLEEELRGGRIFRLEEVKEWIGVLEEELRGGIF